MNYLPFIKWRNELIKKNIYDKLIVLLLRHLIFI